MDRQIVCYQIPAFEVALARLTAPSLRDRPVAVVPSQSPRALLKEVSREAQRDGVLPGMMIDQAQRRCPRIQFVPSDPNRVHQAQRRLNAVIAERAPAWEVIRPGQMFLDMTGTTRLFGPPSDTGLYLERELHRRYGLAGSVGVGTNKLVSRCATTLLDPLQVYEIRPGSEPSFMSPLSVTVLPGLARTRAKVVLATLTDLNLLTWGDIAEVPLPSLEIALGPSAGLMHQWAQGYDAAPVLSPPQQPTVEESVTLTPDDIDNSRLLGYLYRLLERICIRLRTTQRLCHRLKLTIRQSDQNEVTRRQALPSGTAWEADLYPAIQTLLTACTRRRVRLRALTVAAEALLPWEIQLPLFSAETADHRIRERSQRLAGALDKIRARYGEQSIWVGRTHGC